MRLRTVLAIGLLALATAGAQEADRPYDLKDIQFKGGDGDDRRFAMAALGLKRGLPVDRAGFDQALAAVRLVDRFAAVHGVLGKDGVATITLVPLAPLATWQWEGDALPGRLKKTLLPGLRKGMRMGPLFRDTLVGAAEQRMKEAGYPSAQIRSELSQEGRHLRLILKLGEPALIREIRIEGDPSPYSRTKLLRVAGLEPGVTHWTPTVIREAQQRLRKLFVDDHRWWSFHDGRLEGSARLVPGSGPGIWNLHVNPGPKVKLQGRGLSNYWPPWNMWTQPKLSELVPLARAERYAPSLLEEGAGRITTYFKNQGYPEVKVDYKREVTTGTPEKPEAVTLTYTVDHGPRRKLGRILFEGNRELSEEELREAVVVPKRFFVFAAHAKAEVVKAVEDRVTAIYLQRGFPDVRVRRHVETAKDGSVEVRLNIREGPQRFLDALLLDLPAEPGFSRENLAQSLLLALSDRPTPSTGQGQYPSDRRHLQGIKATMEDTPTGVRLRFQPHLPLVRNDLALVVSDLRQRLSSAGAANPQVKLAFEEAGPEPIVRIQVPSQPLDKAKRLVVQGSDQTRAEAVLREAELPPGAPLDPTRLDEGQIQLGGLGAFQRVDLLTLRDLPGQEKEPWERGDLALRLQERSPWVFTEGFGYDSTQGYHFGLNAQRLNVDGMGRVLDFGLRAGDLTLDSEALRRAFRTGDVKRSVDSYSVGYTDPWFLPGALDSWLATRTRFHMEGAYIVEAQAAFLARRRRFRPSLEWKVGPVQVVQFGYRFERVEVAPNTLLSDQYTVEDLVLIAKTPARSVISAPYLQITVDRRDRPYDPTEGTYFLGRLELANQLIGTSTNSSFVKLDLRHQWHWPVGHHAENGVVMAGVRLGLARPTARSAQELPLSERFFGGGSFTVRGVEPDMLGQLKTLTSIRDKNTTQVIPLGGQALAVVNLEYRFPLFGQSVWGEVFVDSGQVYRSLLSEPDPSEPAKWIAPSYPALRTTLGVGLILKLGFPLKVEYAADWKRIMGRPRTKEERISQLKSLLISAGFQF